VSAVDRRLRWAAPLLALGLLALWEAASRRGGLSPLFFPAPTRILARLWLLVENGELFLHFGATLSRMLVALVFGGGAGLLLGLALGYSPRLRAVLDPFVAWLHPVPKLSLLPLIMLIFGIGYFSKALVVAISAFFPMVINAMAGVLQIDPNYYAVARLHGASRATIFRRVVLPASLPMSLAGARMAMNRALGATIALEMITAHTGLGSMLFFAWQTYRTEELYATVFVIAVFGYLFRRATTDASSRLVPWQGSERSA
jgi:NitT/TauT family transport system permease protein